MGDLHLLDYGAGLAGIGITFGKTGEEGREHDGGFGDSGCGLTFTRACHRPQSKRVETPQNRDPAPEADEARLDKWLWSVRAYKTRALAAEACRLGRVTVDGREAKAAASVRPGQVIEARQGIVSRRLVVVGLPRGRQGASKVGDFARDETPPEALEAARQQRVQHILAGGGARPTKRERRERDALWEDPKR